MLGALSFTYVHVHMVRSTTVRKALKSKRADIDNRAGLQRSAWFAASYMGGYVSQQDFLLHKALRLKLEAYEEDQLKRF